MNMKKIVDQVVIGDWASPQRGEHVGKMGRITAIDGSKITVSPAGEGASWTTFEVELADISVKQETPPELACWWTLDEDMTPRPTNDPREFQKTLADPRRRVGKDAVLGRTVSTVFRGTPIPDTNPDGSLNWKNPLLWETCVWDPETGYDVYGRYSTYGNAVIGHRRIVEAVRLLPRLRSDPRTQDN